MTEFVLPVVSLLCTAVVFFFAGWFWSEHRRFIREHREMMGRLDALEVDGSTRTP